MEIEKMITPASSGISNDGVNSTLVDTQTTNEFPKWEDEALEALWGMNSSIPMVAVTVGYLVFVNKLGPYLMKNRKPYDLKHIMMAYNVFQVAFNTWFFSLFITEPKMLGYILQEACFPVTPSSNQYLRLYSFKVTWIWLASKVIDLLDTVFFVLRKKQSQVTFLHVYHHTHMVVSVWIYLKYIRGEQGIMIGFVNCVVHMFMYTYYFLAALGPQVQKYLWWKKYITWVQLVQFFYLVPYFFVLATCCKVPPIQQFYNNYCVCQGMVFIALFLNFYFQSYKKAVRKTSDVNLNGNTTIYTDVTQTRRVIS